MGKKSILNSAKGTLLFKAASDGLPIEPDNLELLEEALFFESITNGILIEPGDTFLSKVTGKLVMCCEIDLGSDPNNSCSYCVYGYGRRVSRLGLGCPGYIYPLRLVEAGYCSNRSRKDRRNVYFKEVESLYEISQETKDLLKILSSSTSSFLKNFGYIRLLLDIEYAVHKDNKG